MAFAKDLRASVLQAAMQGKLTEQLETDTPVSELLADISTKTKKITLLEDDDLPTNWGSVKITDVVTLYTNINRYTDKTILIGDFNSNAKWDKLHGNKNHTVVTKELNEQGFVSAYHHISSEKQGSETTNTFYLHRDVAKGHHIDYCFLKPNILEAFEILDDIRWLEYYDHVPLVLNIK